MQNTFEAISLLSRGQRWKIGVARVIDFLISEMNRYDALKGDVSLEQKLAEKYAKKLSRFSGDRKPYFSKNVYGHTIIIYKNTFKQENN